MSRLVSARGILQQVDSQGRLSDRSRGTIVLFQGEETWSVAVLEPVRDFILCETPISKRMCVYMDYFGHAVSWEDDTEHFRFVFEEQDSENEFKDLLAKLLFEVLRDEKFEKAVPKEAQEWTLRTLREEPMDLCSEDEASSLDESDAYEFEDLSTLGEGKAEEKAENSELLQSILENRSFVLKGDGFSVYRHSRDEELEHVARIPSLYKPSGDKLHPSRAILYQKDARMLCLDEMDPHHVYDIDIERQQVVNEYVRIPHVVIDMSSLVMKIWSLGRLPTWESLDNETIQMSFMVSMEICYSW